MECWVQTLILSLCLTFMAIFDNVLSLLSVFVMFVVCDGVVSFFVLWTTSVKQGLHLTSTTTVEYPKNYLKLICSWVMKVAVILT